MGSTTDMPIYHDITVPVSPETPLWPGDGPVRVEMVADMAKGAPANVSRLCLSSHTGTHVDAPFHFIRNGKKLPEIPLDTLIGPCWVAEFPDLDAVDAVDLEATVPVGTERLLLKTRNSRLWDEKRSDFITDYVFVTPAAAEWIVRRGIRLVGIDYLSLDAYSEYVESAPSAHLTLLRNEVVILETVNLSGIAEGRYQLICLPLLAGNGDGAPARVVLVEE
ncbi:MAG: cyclase family protein [Armatimonadota bacterium]|nr:cyclase family protein [Armatimonadota bacterium]